MAAALRAPAGSWRGVAVMLGAVLCAVVALAVPRVGPPDRGAVSAGAVARASALNREGDFQTLPAPARGLVSATLGRAEPEYWIRDLRAANRPQRLSASFAPRGVTVRSAAGVLRLSLAGVGRRALMGRVAAAVPAVRANEVSYSRPGLREWYANGPYGLEQGFDLTRRPAGDGRLRLALELGGDLRAHQQAGAVVLDGRNGALRLSGLEARDARGRSLPATMRVIGARLVISVDDRAAHYPVRVDPFVQQAELAASDGTTNSYLGYSLAIDGNTIAAGAPLRPAPGNTDAGGAVYVFVKGTAGWGTARQVAELTASDAAPYHELGWSVAISGDTIVAGAPAASHVNPYAGAVYVFVKPLGTGWYNTIETAKLTATDGAGGDELGDAVAISQGNIVAGAPGHAVGANTSQGTQGANLAQGAVYLYRELPGGWINHTQTVELEASDGAPNNQLGFSVAMSGETIAAGSLYHGADLGPGVLYVFHPPLPGLSAANQVAELAPSDGTATDEFGWSVAVTGNVIAAGAPFHQVGANPEQGALYVFTAPSGAWTSGAQTAELTASDGAGGDQLGESIAAQGARIVAGAPGHQVGGNPGQGAAYAYDEPSGGWANGTQTAEITAADGSTDDELGWSVGLSAGNVISGAWHRGVAGHGQQGAAYVFQGPAPVGHPPTDTVPPAVSGTSRPGRTLSCATGTWSANAASFAFQWTRGGTPIAGATESSYRVASADEQLMVACAVTAADATGAAATATSRGMAVPVARRPHCPAATGTLGGPALGPARLGQSRAQVRRAFRRRGQSVSAYVEYYCLTPTGIRVGYASPALLAAVPSSQRARLRGRVAWAATASAFYAVRGVRVGAPAAMVTKTLSVMARLTRQHRTWYFVRRGPATAVVEVSGGAVVEVALAERALAAGSRARLALVGSLPDAAG